MNKLTKSAAGVMLALSTVTFFSCEDDAPKVYGLNGAAQYGKITVTLEGERPDGEDFKETKVFRYLPEENVGYSSVSYDGDAYFYVQRQHGAVTNSHNDNYAALDFQSDADGETAVNGEFYLYTSVIDDDDNVFFYLNDNFSINLDDITSFSYNEETGKFKLEFSTEIDGESNDTGNDLTVTVEVSVTVFEGLNGGGGGEF